MILIITHVRDKNKKMRNDSMIYALIITHLFFLNNFAEKDASG